jgi:hypothetical protein
MSQWEVNHSLINFDVQRDKITGMVLFRYLAEEKYCSHLC